ncbi:MAG: RagB/SusD family nutrient uptake outer membrane protein [Alistipes sp.]|nr:RagB/SusD family nutrient uptake outer membrane protein [Alistipes sp.]
MKRIIYFVTTALAFAFWQCSDALDMEPDGRLEIKEIFSDYLRTAAYFNSCYNYIAERGFTYEPGSPTLLASFSDEAHDSEDNKDGSVSAWYRGVVSPSYNPVATTSADHWGNYFRGIRKCNSFLQYISDPEIATYEFNEEEKAGWIAQIHVIRAHLYLQLFKRYGPVPLIATPYELDHDYSADRREPAEKMVDFILADCDKALATPEPETSFYGFRWDRPGDIHIMTRGVAYAIKSQAALYAASPLWYEQGSKYTWAKAAEITKEALDMCLANGFSLYTDQPDPTYAQNAYAYYFITRSDANRGWDKETILDSRGLSAQVWKYAGLPTTGGMSKAGPCPTQELVDAYETVDGQPVLDLTSPYADAEHTRPNYNPASIYDPDDPYANRDPRFYASIYYNGAVRNLDNPSGTLVETFVGGNEGISDRVTESIYTRTGYYLRKFNNWRSGIGNETDGWMRIYRLGELYLNFAEAAYNHSGPDSQVPSTVPGQPAMSAREAVNAIRNRAGMPDLPSGMSTADFELRYRNERRVELAFEEHRFFDVRRWKILDHTDRYITGMKIEASPSGYIYQRLPLQQRPNYEDKYLRYPISQSEINKMLYQTGENWQNPGWE